MFTDFQKDILKGKIREHIFQSGFCDFLYIKSKDVSNDIEYRKKDIDIITTDFSVDVKSLTFTNAIIIEDYTNINPELSKISEGWLYKSKADIIAFVYYKENNKDDKNNGLIVLLPFSDKFKEWYNANKSNYDLVRNKISIKGERKWQSAYRKIPFSDLNGWISFYKLNLQKVFNQY